MYWEEAVIQVPEDKALCNPKYSRRSLIHIDQRYKVNNRSLVQRNIDQVDTVSLHPPHTYDQLDMEVVAPACEAYHLF